jgi:hypothetical protein
MEVPMRFEAQDNEALRILGFTIVVDSKTEVAILKGEMTISINRNAQGDRLSIAITLPGGGEIAAMIPRALLHEAARLTRGA